MSSSKSKTSSQTQYTTKTSNLNLQGVSGAAAGVSGDSNVVHVTDGGAVGKALDFAGDIGGEAIDAVKVGAADAVAAALNFGVRALEHGDRASRGAMEMVFDASQPDQATGRNLTSSALIAAAIVAGTVLVAKGSK